MRQIVFILICIACLHVRAMGQALTDCTISACSINAEMLTGMMGEASVSAFAGNETALMPGFIEVLLSTAVDIPKDPVDTDPSVDVPTSVEQVEASVKIVVNGNLLQVYCDQFSWLTIYNLSGNMIVRKSVNMECVSPLASGMYIVVVQNQKNREVFKVNISK